MTLGHGDYSVFRGGGYPRDARITARFSDLPQPSLWQTVRNRIQESSAFVKYGTPIVAGAVMALLIGFAIWRRGRPAPTLGGRRFGGGGPEVVPSQIAEAGTGRQAPGSFSASEQEDGGGTAGPGLPAAEKADRQAIVRDIALLDERFEAGEIEEAEYRRRREELTRRALDASNLP